MKYAFLILVISVVTSLFPAELKWQGWTDGLAAVKAQKKPAIVDFYTDWCKWCKVMDEKTFNEAKVNAMLKKSFITMRINPEKSTETIQYDKKTFNASEFAQALGVQGYPALVFVDKTGQLITMMPGYIPPETFIQLLQYVKDECYVKKISFEDYQKNGKCK